MFKFSEKGGEDQQGLRQLRHQGQEAQMKKTLGFLKRIFGKAKGDIEIRCLPSRHRLFTRDLEKIRAFIKSHIAEEVFFGVATRKGKNGSKAGTSELRVLWADIDWKDFAGGKNEADKRISEFSLKPSIIVSSGYGYHLYWILKKPLKAGLEIEGYIKGIASAVGADRGATDIARILRVPGTFNRKNGGKILVTRTNDNGLRYELPDFEQWRIETKKVPKQAVNFTGADLSVDIQSFGVSAHIRELILKGWRGSPLKAKYKSRSEADEAVITGLLNEEATDDEIQAIFKEYPIGEKYREKGPDGDQYLRHSIGEAKAFLKDKSLKRKNYAGMDTRKLKSRTSNEGMPIEGKVRPLVQEGLRVMILIDYKLKSTRHGFKDYLYWRDERVSQLILEQYFPHHEPYPRESKAVKNYIAALPEKPENLEKIDLKTLIGLRAEVYVETVRPTYDSGALKGKPRPENLHYSKVSEILKPLGYVNLVKASPAT